MRIATLSYFALVVGLFYRKHRIRHVSLMNAAIVIDLALVLILEFQRSAINTAISFKLSIWNQLHIGSSTLAVLLYFPVVILGFLRFFNKASIDKRIWHMRLGITAFIFRTLGYILMFSLIK